MRFSGFLYATSILFCSAFAQTPDATPSLLEAYVDGVVTAHMRQHHTPGVTVSVVKDGRTLFSKGYGYADIENGTMVRGDDTLFRIGSVSKTFIWSAVMMLVERGQLDLDTDVNEYLQGVTIPQAFGAPVTLNHLMAHRAGFESTIAVFTHMDDAETPVTDALNRDMPARVNPPGARTSYSNWGSTLASKIVADVSGVSYEQFLQDEIFTPLGMTNTTLKPPALMSPRFRERLSVGYEMKNGAPESTEYMQIGPYAPAGSVASTAEDMARWMLVHLGRGEHDGALLLSRETHEQMWARAFGDRPSGADLAHGFMSKRYYGYDQYGHGGSTAAFYTYMMLVPDLGVGVFVSQNAADDRGLVSELPDLVVQRLAATDRGPGETITNETLADRAKECAGTFLQNRRSFTKFEKLFASNTPAVVAPGEDGSVTVTAQGESTRYAPVAGAEDTYQDRYGNRIIFGRDEAGRVSHYSGAWGVHSLERVGTLDSPNSVNLVLGVVLLFSITTWLGVLWRRGVPVRHTAVGSTLNYADCAAAVVFFAFVGSIGWMIAVLSSMSAADLVHYPPFVVTVLRAIGLVLFLIGVAAVLSLWPAWRSSGWNAWRKIHHSLFALSLAALAFMLIKWNVVFASTAV